MLEVSVRFTVTPSRMWTSYASVSSPSGTSTLFQLSADSARELRSVYGLHVATIPPRLPSRRTMLPDRVFVDDASRWNAIESEIARLHGAGRPVLIGCRTIDGGHMAVGQALRAFELFTGRQPDAARMDAHFRRLVS